MSRRPAYVYVAKNTEGRVKIGMSKNPALRVANMGRGTTLVWQTPEMRDDAFCIEFAAMYEVRHYRWLWEWFWCDETLAVEAVKRAIAKADAGEAMPRGRLPDRGAFAPPDRGWTKEQAMERAKTVPSDAPYCQGTRAPSDKILAALGLERAPDRYRRIKR